MARAGALIGVLLLLLPAASRAQSTASLVAAAESEVTAATAAGTCTAEASELAAAATRLRTEGDALLVRALTSYVTTLRAQLTTCMGPSTSSTASSPRGRFRTATDDAEESGSGSFDMQQVVRMIQTRRGAITRCYETALATTPTLAGRIRVSLTIQESGTVVSVSATENTLGSDAVASCVVRVVQGFRFNPGPADGSVTYAFPFDFEPVR